MCIVEARDCVNLSLVQIPVPIKLVQREDWLLVAYLRT